MILRREWRWAATRALLLVAVAALPYLIAFLTTPPDLFYTGFLSNPEDGNAYLAKMQQGLRGEWRYHLPYTAEPHRGEWLFTYYILLGHVARWTGLSPILIFHLARAINGFVLLLVLYYFVATYLPDRSQRRFAFTLIAIGSGLGWVAALLGGMTADLWVPEGYVVYSIFVNPHFPLASALMLLAIAWSTTPMCSDSSTPSIAAPASTSPRFTPAAKLLSFHFFLTDLTLTSSRDLLGRTKAVATIKPVSSSTAYSVFSSWVWGWTSVQIPQP